MFEALRADSHAMTRSPIELEPSPGVVRFALFGLVLGIAFLSVALLVFTLELDILG